MLYWGVFVNLFSLPYLWFVFPLFISAHNYILIGEIYLKEKDYFNAKATLQSVVDNTLNPELKAEAQAKLNEVIEEESKSSKLNN